MLGRSFVAGLAAIRQRPGLVLLIYGVNLALAVVLAVPVFVVLSDVVGPTGFGPELAREFDIVLWWDIMEEAGSTFQTLWTQLLWIIPLYLIWNIAANVGLIHALRGRGKSFWHGVSHYTGRGMLLGLLYLVPLLAWAVLTAIVVAVMRAAWGGEVGTFWRWFIILPAMAVIGLVIIDLMQDYGRIALVADNVKVTKAWRMGMGWPRNYALSILLYVPWFVGAAALLVVPTLLEASLLVTWAVFFLQQIVMLLRAAVTVGWIGSEVSFFEQVRWAEAPLIAEAQPVAIPVANLGVVREE